MPISRELTQIELTNNQNKYVEIFDLFVEKICSHPLIQENRIQNYGPTIKTKIRFEKFTELKDRNPSWTLEKIAMEASEELGEFCSAETVRNAYRTMGEEWKRGDRTR